MHVPQLTFLSLPPAATIGFFAVLGTATADISATNDYVTQLRYGTTAEDLKINPRTRQRLPLL